jgi:hypothetical protein
MAKHDPATPAHGTHVHGTMDTREQEKTFAGFIRASVWVAGVSVAILIFLALVNA